jgi:hypothetical protein
MRSPANRITPLVVALAAIVAFASGGCQSQRRFATPADAVAALTTAAESGDRADLRDLFGPRVAELRSGDPDQDEVDIASFRRRLSEATEIETTEPDKATLLIGQTRWPFAVPIVREHDMWRFDTDAGIEELDNRRIGRNELRTIAACRTLIAAQNEYRSADRNGDGMPEYASRLMSTEGTKDGLYWPSPGGVDPSPIGPVFAQAAIRTDDAGERMPFNGYNFKGLPPPGRPCARRCHGILRRCAPCEWLGRHRLARRMGRLRRHDLHRQPLRRDLRGQPRT